MTSLFKMKKIIIFSGFFLFYFCTSFLFLNRYTIISKVQIEIPNKIADYDDKLRVISNSFQEMIDEFDIGNDDFYISRRFTTIGFSENDRFFISKIQLSPKKLFKIASSLGDAGNIKYLFQAFLEKKMIDKGYNVYHIKELHLEYYFENFVLAVIRLVFISLLFSIFSTCFFRGFDFSIVNLQKKKSYVCYKYQE